MSKKDKDKDEQLVKGDDVYSHLFKKRIIFLTGGVDQEVCSLIVARLLYLEQQDPEADIYFYISSPGGFVYPGLSIYDTMNLIKPDVQTICSGWSASMAAILLANGAPNKRHIMPSAQIMIHQPSQDNLSGMATDIEIYTKQLLKIKRLSAENLAKNTGQPLKKVIEDMERDRWMSSEEAIEYGLVDKVWKPEPPAKPKAATKAKAPAKRQTKAKAPAKKQTKAKTPSKKKK